MPEQRERTLLVLNTGSSSVKFALYRLGGGEELLVSGAVDRIGLDGGVFRVVPGTAGTAGKRSLDLADHDAALKELFGWLAEEPAGRGLSAIGHRVVMGGPELTRPVRITPQVVETLRRLVPLAPNHLPPEVRTIEAAQRAFPELPQVACFDTAFHADLPNVARRYALPADLRAAGVRRYGFHGLSYQYIVEELRRTAPAEAAGRLVIAHLGNGCSMAAVRDGRPVDTTMGLTPLGGLIMSTRCGDIDPGVILYLMRAKGMDAAALDDLLSKRSGLLALSGFSSDVRDLLAREAQDVHAAEALASFCYQARKFLAALAAALGGLDTLVFTAGIGEHSPVIRARICDGLAFLGVRLDPQRNAAGTGVISADGAAVTVRVMATNEELMIARQTYQAVGERGVSTP